MRAQPNEAAAERQTSRLDQTIVIIGSGHAGVTAASALREGGWRGPISLFGDESEDPYQRPPLSKQYLADGRRDDIALISATALNKLGISFRRGLAIDRLDLATRKAVLANGTATGYDHAVLATGATARPLAVEGFNSPKIASIRTRRDAELLRSKMAHTQRLLVIGAGFLGLEIATIASQNGIAVSVIEAAEAPLAAAVSPPVSSHLAKAHSARGVRFRFASQVQAFTTSSSTVIAHLSDGADLEADLAVVSVGAVPNDDIATRSGIDANGGVVTDAHLRTSATGVYAIGDCARYPSAFVGRSTVTESIQNATGQARYVAAALIAERLGQPYSDLPWFWSNQADQLLQIAGIALPDDDYQVVSQTEGALVVERRRQGALTAVETINDRRSHMKARRNIHVPPPDTATT